ncbi:MAG: FIST signal transduction protein [Vulcanimicrobiota bacterium]
MKASQRSWSPDNGWSESSSPETDKLAQLVLAFAGRSVLGGKSHYDELRNFYPNAHILSCSTAGEIEDIRITDDTIIATAIFFKDTPLRVTQLHIDDVENSQIAGEKIAEQLNSDDLSHVFVISDGQHINGTKLAKGMSAKLSRKVHITGGLAGNGVLFKCTLVGIDAPPSEGNIAAVGFYGKKLRVGFGSVGGWDSFGPERLITKSRDNVLYELDYKSALKLYKEYLGDKANDLPGSGLLFPLCIRTEESAKPLVRTILAVNEDDQSMTFAGDMPYGAYARLMKASSDSLIEGARKAAVASLERSPDFRPDLAILISCVGRRLVMRQRIEEEIETIREVLGDNTVITGFYSYGELAPFNPGLACEFHNQTMTITAFGEYDE